MELPYSEACERNRGPILTQLLNYLAETGRVLEIGSGTAQHATYFSRALPHLTWITSDLVGNLAGIRARLAEEGFGNTQGPLSLDVSVLPWPVDEVDSVFTANTLHIMSWEDVEQFFRGVGAVLVPGGLLIVYGPFTYGGEFTSRSNANFDTSLKLRDPESGIRDFGAINELARQEGLTFIDDHPMPANNQLLIWARQV